MHKAALLEASLFKLVILISCIVVAMFVSAVLMALAFMPSGLIAGLPTEDTTFLLPLALATLCATSILAWYVRSYRVRQGGQRSE